MQSVREPGAKHAGDAGDTGARGEPEAGLCGSDHCFVPVFWSLPSRGGIEPSKAEI